MRLYNKGDDGPKHWRRKTLSSKYLLAQIQQ